MDLTTFVLPTDEEWPLTTAAFGAMSLPILQPSPDQLGALAARLASSAERLRAIPIAALVGAIDRVAMRWHDPTLPARAALEATLPLINNYSPAMVRHVVGRMAADWRADVLWQRLRTQFGNPLVLDDWHPFDAPALDHDLALTQHQPTLTRAWGPQLTLHLCAGNVPGVAIQSLVDALLVKSPSLVKPASGEPLWAALWGQMLIEELPDLAVSLAVLWWPGGDAAREAAVLAHTEAVIVNASNQTISDLRRRLPEHVRLLDYGSRISFAAIAASVLTPEQLPAIARSLAYDVAVFDQNGCVSPQMVFVESTDAQTLWALIQALDAAMTVIDRELPYSPSSAGASTLRRLHDDYEWRMLAGHPATLHGPPDGRWTIICDAQAAFAPGVAGRTLMIRPVADLAEVPALLGPLTPFLQSAALAVPPERLRLLATMLAEAGVSRITHLGQQGWPAPVWHHDGRDPLRALVRWTDLERLTHAEQTQNEP